MEKELAQLKGHLIVCGSGQTAVYTALERDWMGLDPSTRMRGLDFLAG